VTDAAPPRIPYRPPRPTLDEVRARVAAEYATARTRRTVRHFASAPVPREVIEAALLTAGTAPSGAHQQPWYFVAIQDAALKGRIREAAEKEERDFYERRAPDAWLEAIAPIGTDADKPHLTDAPWLIVVFQQNAVVDGAGVATGKTYYASESVGIAVGMLLRALHGAGLATLTHTPAPMVFLREVLGRPKHERPFVIIPVGFPAEDATVPDLERKPLSAIAEFR
jgi:iodotyrosine deiodinase